MTERPYDIAYEFLQHETEIQMQKVILKWLYNKGVTAGVKLIKRDMEGIAADKNDQN